MTARGHQLWLALRLRDLPLSALAVDAPPAQPVVVGERRQVVFCNAAAAALGIARGMDLATAQLVGDCRTLPRDRGREAAALQELRGQLYRFTPHIAIHHSRKAPQSGLLLEISTCLRLFGGVEALCREVLGMLTAGGHDLRHGLAHTAPGAWLLSFARHGIDGSDTRELFVARLNQLPVQVLYEHPAAVDALIKMGFTTLGDVVRQVESSALGSFAKRLGRDFATALGEIYGSDGHFAQASLFTPAVTSWVPEALFTESIQFDYPVTLAEQLAPAVESLLQNLADFLRRRQLACQHIQWQMSDIHQRREVVDVHSDLPQSGWQLLYDLTLIRLANRPMPFAVDSLTLSCRDRLPAHGNSQRLDFTGAGRRRDKPRELAVTMARLKSRVGDAAVYRVGYRDNLLPELSHTLVGLAEKSVQQLPDSHNHSLRPGWLFAQPLAVEQRNRRLYWQGYLTLAVGPERVVGHWWQEPVARDYYLARRQDNTAVWVYQDLYSKAWYVQGVFS